MSHANKSTGKHPHPLAWCTIIYHGCLQTTRTIPFRGHASHDPPQSTSTSSPFWTPSAQVAPQEFESKALKAEPERTPQTRVIEMPLPSDREAVPSCNSNARPLHPLDTPVCELLPITNLRADPKRSNSNGQTRISLFLAVRYSVTLHGLTYIFSVSSDEACNSCRQCHHPGSSRRPQCLLKT